MQFLAQFPTLRRNLALPRLLCSTGRVPYALGRRNQAPGARIAPMSAGNSIEKYGMGAGSGIRIPGGRSLRDLIEAAIAANECAGMTPPARPAAPRRAAVQRTGGTALARRTHGMPTRHRVGTIKQLPPGPRLGLERLRALALRRSSPAHHPIRSRHAVRRRRSQRRCRTATSSRGSPSSSDGDPGRSSCTRAAPQLGGAR